MKSKKVLLAALLSTILLTSCGQDKAKTTDVKANTSENTNTPTVKMLQSYGIGHDNGLFVVSNVTMNGDKIVDVKLNEFLYMDKDASWTPVPNSDNALAESYPDGKFLVTKMENTDTYSAMMRKYAKPTHSWKENIDLITSFAKGKTLAELEETNTKLSNKDIKIADAVTGATLVNTKNYLQDIINTVKSGIVSEGIQTNNTSLKEAMILGKPHGTKGFATISVAMDGDKIAAVFIDEFQYAPSKDVTPVPNSDKDVAKGTKNDVVLFSKQVNNNYYSNLMKEHAKSTRAWADNIKSIISFANGKTVAQLEASLKDVKSKEDKGVDAVTGATLVDTKNYLQAIIDAAKKASE